MGDQIAEYELNKNVGNGRDNWDSEPKALGCGKSIIEWLLENDKALKGFKLVKVGQSAPPTYHSKREPILNNQIMKGRY